MLSEHLLKCYRGFIHTEPRVMESSSGSSVKTDCYCCYSGGKDLLGRAGSYLSIAQGCLGRVLRPKRKISISQSRSAVKLVHLKLQEPSRSNTQLCICNFITLTLEKGPPNGTSFKLPQTWICPIQNFFLLSHRHDCSFSFPKAIHSFLIASLNARFFGPGCPPHQSL